MSSASSNQGKIGNQVLYRPVMEDTTFSFGRAYSSGGTKRNMFKYRSENTHDAERGTMDGPEV